MKACATYFRSCRLQKSDSSFTQSPHHTSRDRSRISVRSYSPTPADGSASPKDKYRARSWYNCRARAVCCRLSLLPDRCGSIWQSIPGCLCSWLIRWIRCRGGYSARLFRPSFGWCFHRSTIILVYWVWVYRAKLPYVRVSRNAQFSVYFPFNKL